jgi:ABC-type glycerol-3-phosphate transport system substrate-binding protein
MPPKPAEAPKPAETPKPAEPAKPAAPSSASGAPTSRGRPGEPRYSPTRLEGKTLTLWALDFAPHKTRYTDMLADFGKYTGAKGTVQTQSGQFDAKLVAAIAAGQPPDIVSALGRSTPVFIKQGLIEPVDDQVFKAVGLDPKQWWTPGSVDAFWNDGKYWGVPWEDTQVGSGYGARLDYLREEKLDGQWPAGQGRDAFESYEELWDLARKLHKESGGQVTRWGLNSAGWLSKSVFGQMKMLGTDWWQPEKKKFNMDGEAGVKALEMLVETPAQKLKIEGELSMSGRDATMQGKVAIGRATVSMVPLAKEQGVEIETVMAPPPVKGGKVVYVGEGGWGVVVPKQAKNKDAALEFLRFGTTYECQYDWAKTALPVPAIKAMAEDPLYKGDDHVKKSIQRWIKSTAQTVYIGNDFGNEGAVSATVDAVGSEVRSGKLSAKEGARKMQAEFEKQYKEFFG